MLSRKMSEEERLAYCKEIVQAQRDSGMSVARWCDEHSVSRARFYRYKKISEEPAESGVYKVPGWRQCPKKSGRSRSRRED